jgi:chemotaxis signal transduction protein
MTGAHAEELLTFSLGGADFALRLRDVRGVGACAALRPVPGTHPAVLGLAEWRGAVLTVVDLARLLGQPPAAARPCLIRLSEPLRGVAFHLLAVARVRAEPERGERAPEATLLDPARLLRGLESTIRRAG